MPRCKFTTHEVRQHHREELARLAYMVAHSRSQTTEGGAAPNTSTNQAQLQRYEQTSVHDRVRVLRFD